MTQDTAAPEAGQEVATQEQRSQVVITDPQAIRALAHRARIEALDELFASHGTRTATELAARSHLTPSAMSYHLRALEKYGFVERAESEGDARERRWRAAGDQLVVRPLGGSPTGMTAYVDLQLTQLRERVSDEVMYRQRLRAEGRPTPDFSVMFSGMAFLDAEEETEFLGRLGDLANEFELRSRDRSGGENPGRRTYYLLSALPEREPEA